MVAIVAISKDEILSWILGPEEGSWVRERRGWPLETDFMVSSTDSVEDGCGRESCESGSVGPGCGASGT